MLQKELFILHFSYSLLIFSALSSIPPPSFPSPSSSHMTYRHVRTLMAQIEEDEIAMSGLNEDRRQFLEKALHNYVHCLRTGVSFVETALPGVSWCRGLDFLTQDEHDLRVFRLCALWFANASDAKINAIITVSE